MTICKINIPKSIILLIVFSIILNILRVLIWHTNSFIYILWNIFLALLPFLISSFLLRSNDSNKLTKTIFIISGFFWLLLIPNSPYIITDLIHIGEVRSVPVLFDVFLLFNSAMVGILLGMHSVFHMEQILKTKYSRKITIIFGVISILLTGFGIYLGRFLRFNSWDVFVKPGLFYTGIIEIFKNKANLFEASLYTLFFSFFIFITYISWKSTQKK